MVVGGEAIGYLSIPDVMLGRRPGEDVRCDEAVATLCHEYRAWGVAPRWEDGLPARRACAVLLMYAHKYLAEAALGQHLELLDEGLLAMEVGDAAKLDPRECGRVLDRFILLIGSLQAETPLLSSAARLRLSGELKTLIRKRLASMA